MIGSREEMVSRNQNGEDISKMRREYRESGQEYKGVKPF